MMGQLEILCGKACHPDRMPAAEKRGRIVCESTVGTETRHILHLQQCGFHVARVRYGLPHEIILGGSVRYFYGQVFPYCRQRQIVAVNRTKVGIARLIGIAVNIFHSRTELIESGTGGLACICETCLHLSYGENDRCRGSKVVTGAALSGRVSAEMIVSGVRVFPPQTDIGRYGSECLTGFGEKGSGGLFYAVVIAGNIDCIPCITIGTMNMSALCPYSHLAFPHRTRSRGIASKEAVADIVCSCKITSWIHGGPFVLVSMAVIQLPQSIQVDRQLPFTRSSRVVGTQQMLSTIAAGGRAVLKLFGETPVNVA